MVTNVFRLNRGGGGVSQGNVLDENLYQHLFSWSNISTKILQHAPSRSRPQQQHYFNSAEPVCSRRTTQHSASATSHHQHHLHIQPIPHAEDANLNMYSQESASIISIAFSQLSQHAQEETSVSARSSPASSSHIYIFSQTNMLKKNKSTFLGQKQTPLK